MRDQQNIKNYQKNDLLCSVVLLINPVPYLF